MLWNWLGDGRCAAEMRQGTETGGESGTVLLDAGDRDQALGLTRWSDPRDDLGCLGCGLPRNEDGCGDDNRGFGFNFGFGGGSAAGEAGAVEFVCGS